MSVTNNEVVIVAGHKIIYNPENPAEVCTVIGGNKADVGYVCSRHTLINKWAKYKPVSVNGLIDTVGWLETTSQQIGTTGKYYRPWKSSAVWWKGNGTCGMEVHAPRVISSTTDDTHKTTAQLEAEAADLEDWYRNNWGYKFYPQGGLTSPYRLIDFHMYDHNAVPFIKSITHPDYVVHHAGDDSEDSLTWTLALPTSAESQYSLSAEDVAYGNAQLSTSHFGLIFLNTGSEESTTSALVNRKYMYVNSTQLGNGGTSITLPGALTASLIDSGSIRQRQNYTVYPVLVANNLSVSDIFVFGTYTTNIVAMPTGSTVNMTFVPNELDGQIQGTFDFMDIGNVRVFDRFYLSLLNTNGSKSMVIDSVTRISLFFDIYIYSNGTYTFDRTVQSSTGGTSDLQVTTPSFPITIAGRGSCSVYLRWPIDISYFASGVTYSYRVRGTVTYKKNGVSSTATLLSFPSREPREQKITLPYRISASVVTKTSTGATVKLNVTNTSSTQQSLSWNNIKYDLSLYAYDSGGSVNYQNPSVRSNQSIDTTTQTIPAYQSIDKDVEITGITGYTYGYFATMTIHPATGFEMQQASVTIDYRPS